MILDTAPILYMTPRGLGILVSNLKKSPKVGKFQTLDCREKFMCSMEKVTLVDAKDHPIPVGMMVTAQEGVFRGVFDEIQEVQYPTEAIGVITKALKDGKFDTHCYLVNVTERKAWRVRSANRKIEGMSQMELVEKGYTTVVISGWWVYNHFSIGGEFAEIQ